MAREKPARIIIAEPDPSIADTLKEFLEHIGYEAITVDRHDEVVRVTVEEKGGVVLLDHLLSITSETDVLDELMATDSTMCVIMMVSCPLVEYVVAAFRRGAFDVVIKPVDLFELDRIVHKACDRHEFNKVLQFVTANLESVKELMGRKVEAQHEQPDLATASDTRC